MRAEMMQAPLRDEPPSTYAISALVAGEAGSLGRVANLTLTRMVFIAPGLWLSGIRGTKLLTTSGAVSLSITGGLALVY
jgi:hypothetical protein